MEAKKIVFYTAGDARWDALYELWEHCNSIGAFVDAIRKDYPDLVVSDPETEDVYDITDMDDRYVLSWEDGMDECVSIYERLSPDELLPL